MDKAGAEGYRVFSMPRLSEANLNSIRIIRSLKSCVLSSKLLRSLFNVVKKIVVRMMTMLNSAPRSQKTRRLLNPPLALNPLTIGCHPRITLLNQGRDYTVHQSSFLVALKPSATALIITSHTPTFRALPRGVPAKATL